MTAGASTATAPGSFVRYGGCDSSDASQIWARGGEFQDINLTGLRHVGLYPDFIEEMKVVGMTNQDVAPVYQSAEAFIQMWERIQWTK